MTWAQLTWLIFQLPCNKQRACSFSILRESCQRAWPAHYPGTNSQTAIPHRWVWTSTWLAKMFDFAVDAWQLYPLVENEWTKLMNGWSTPLKIIFLYHQGVCLYNKQKVLVFHDYCQQLLGCFICSFICSVQATVSFFLLCSVLWQQPICERD